MDPQYAYMPRGDIWQLQADLKTVSTIQAEHAERILRLERRQEDDARIKSVWGTSSPFPGVLGGTPQQGPVHNPSGGEFLDFDQTQQGNLLGGLQLDQGDEPRRGASRANSVRFDEKAIHGHWAQGSRSSGDSLPLRMASGFGGHLMTERSSSHKSDGRQSSAGQSVHSAHSARTNSLRLDTSYSVVGGAGTSLESTGPPPGLFILGPCPSIIRCWLGSHFSNDTLLYAVICTGSYKSFLDVDLVHRLRLEEQLFDDDDGQTKLKLPVFLPEATTQHSSSHSSSPAHSLPALTVDFSVVDLGSDIQDKRIQVFLGSDTLRSHNADVLFSQSVITLRGDDRHKISVPLVRPENDDLFTGLYTSSATSYSFERAQQPPDLESRPISQPARSLQTKSRRENGSGQRIASNQPGTHSALRSTDRDTQRYDNTPPRPISDTLRDDQGAELGKDSTDTISGTHLEVASSTPIGQERAARIQTTMSNAENSVIPVEDHGVDSGPTITNTSASKDPPGGVWNSWRRDHSSKGDVHTANSPSSGNYQRAGRGRGTKVLRPSKSGSSSSARPYSAVHSSTGTYSSPHKSKDVNRSSVAEERRRPEKANSTSAEVKSATVSSSARTPTSAGGAFAFSWLNGGPNKQTPATGD
ncbi:MAG: hypothetical protein M1833_002996 [Piccolia ochrophora]|nr:MAG: hypothetical protein M1833_002996 [Piccolia ochrophora]